MEDEPGQHGPWKYMLREQCPLCGEWFRGYEEYAHVRTERHLDAQFRAMTPEAWEQVLADVEHGLGWASGESMSSADDEWVMAMLRRALLG